MTSTILLEIATRLAEAAATMACWIEDDCHGDPEVACDEASAAACDARIAMRDLARWELEQAGQQELL